MKLKTSFFNKTIFWKNVALYWPLWGGYTLLLLLLQPLMIWSAFYRETHSFGITFSQKLEEVIFILEPSRMLMIIAPAAVIFGMAVFSYLYNSKSANMIHALPVNKTELFGTNVISGLAFLIVPQILTFIVSVFVCLLYGMTRVEYLAIMLLVSIAIAFIAFAFVTICAMFTGQLFALPVYVLILNFFSYWVYFLLLSVVSVWGYGVTQLGSNFEKLVENLSPFMCLEKNLFINTVRENEICVGMQLYGTKYLFAYFVVAVVLYVAAYWIYQKRHIESAGELLSVKCLKPVFRYGIGLSGGLFGSLLIREFIVSLDMNYTLPEFVLIMLLFGALSYLGADMFVRKTFHVFKKKNWIGCGAFSVCLLVTFFSLYGITEYYEAYTPKIEDIESAVVCMNYSIEKEQADAAEIIALHEQILSAPEYERIGSYWEDGNYEYVQIRYFLKNEDCIIRNYLIPYEDEKLEQVIRKIEAMEKEPENYLLSIIGKNYDKVREFGTGWLEARFLSDMETAEWKEEDCVYQTKSLTPETVEKLWAAVIADVKAGTLIKYNVYSKWTENVGEGVNLSLQYHDPDINYGTTTNVYETNSYGYTEEIFIQEYQDWSSVHLSFGKDCKNIQNALVECGVISSIEELYWGELTE